MWGLQELALPDPVSWAPATYGWGLLAGLLFIIACALAYKSFRQWQSQAYRREALADLARMERDRDRLADLPLVLRRTALSAYPREEVAALNGREWIEWLNAAGANFSTCDADPLDQLAYQPGLCIELDMQTIERLLSASRAFLRDHRAHL